ncbi:MAG TPA: MFS transporter, partial [Mycobacterium sp.]|nr:MFS transporter [Mycobacterium sp.]
MTTLTEHFEAPPPKPPDSPWRALWAMMVGFFMILVDSTIVAVANPRIMEKLDTDYNAVIWVTSAYLLAYAVPLLVAGRLGDRFGPKNLYLIGLAIFTAASLWCGLSGSIGMLITARVVQGLGAGLLTPQTLSTITRIFPADRRGVAMSVWGATAGVATLVGPLAGGLLVDSLGWQWIFFVNVPIGIVGIALAVRLVPVLPTDQHRFDIMGVLLSGVAMFLIVFGLQEGQSHHWSLWIWATIAGGLAMMGAFVYWQRVNKNEPLIPLRVFSDRDFSLSNAAIAVMGFVVVAMVLPLMFYLQAVCGLSPTRSALVMAPTAVAAGLLAPAVGRIVDRSHPGPIVGFGFATLASALTWLSIEMTPTTPMWRLVLPFAAMGVGMAFIWAPLAATATRDLPPDLAGAGSGVYNTTRQVGSVLGSASMAAFMTWRIGDELPSQPDGAAPRGEGAVTQLPAFLHQPFSDAMSQSTLLPAFVALFGVVAALFLVGGRLAPAPPSGAAEFGKADDDQLYDFEPRTDEIPAIHEQYLLDEYGVVFDDEDNLDEYGAIFDDDDYDDEDYDAVYALAPPEQPADVVPSPPPDDSDTAPLALRADPGHVELVQLQPKEPYEPLYHDPPDSWMHPSAEPIEFAHNGFHVDREQRFREVGDQLPSRGRHAAHSGPGDGWMDPDADRYGRHS